MNLPVDEDHRLLLKRDIDPDTRVLRADYFRIGDIPILLETWTWEGISGSTAVLLTSRIKGMDDGDLKNFLNDKARLDISGSTTICRREVHTFVNFGFSTE